MTNELAGEVDDAGVVLERGGERRAGAGDEDNVGVREVGVVGESQVGVADEAVVVFAHQLAVAAGTDNADEFDVGVMNQQSQQFTAGVRVSVNDGGFNHSI